MTSFDLRKLRTDRRRERRAVIEAIAPAELQAAGKEWLSGEPIEIRVLPAE
jgi:hypothetical protein